LLIKWEVEVAAQPRDLSSWWEGGRWGSLALWEGDLGQEVGGLGSRCAAVGIEELVVAVDAVVGPSLVGGLLEEDQLEGEDLPTAAAVDAGVAAGVADVVGDVGEPSGLGWEEVLQWVEDLEVAVVG